MRKIEELHLVVELLRKHNLPLSPILEFAIKERKEQYAMDTNEVFEVRKKATILETNKDLNDYMLKFANLSVGVIGGKKLPHKAILLLAVMNLIESGVIIDNRIELGKTIANAFSSCWRKYFDNLKVPSIWTPFWYMKSESFWHFMSIGNEELLQKLLAFAGHPSIGQMRPVIKYAYFDRTLFEYLENEICREKLKDILIRSYITCN